MRKAQRIHDRMRSGSTARETRTPIFLRGEQRTLFALCFWIATRVHEPTREDSNCASACACVCARSPPLSSSVMLRAAETPSSCQSSGNASKYVSGISTGQTQTMLMIIGTNVSVAISEIPRARLRNYSDRLFDRFVFWRFASLTFVATQRAAR